MTPTELPADNAPAASSRTASIEFSGSKSAFTKLWLVNLLLSIITLGIYSAWAKVRNNQYLYGHTQIEGHRFQYLAKPLQILRGRIIAVVFFVAYGFISSLNPALGGLMALLLLLLMPWLIVQGLKFTLRNSAYRGVRFSFEGTYGGVFVHFLLLPIVGVVTLYLAMPWVVQRIQKYTYENATYGGKPFTLNTSAGEYYKAVLLCLGIGIAAIVVFSILMSVFGIAAVLSSASEPGYGGQMSQGAAISFIIGYLFTIICFMFISYLISAVYQGMIRNHIFNNLSAEDIFKTHSDVKLMPFTGLMITNALIVLFTLGLGYPVTRIRKQKFLAAATTVTLEPAIDHLVNTVDETHSAFGEEAAGLFDVDLSLT
tara:strand:- start:147622 stop:148734 length:1113 start_codon:yes stop_codon:yes gene_type:complete